MKKIPTLLDLYRLITEDKSFTYTIYCDMDGVLCNFDKGYKDLTGMSTDEANMYPKPFFWELFRKNLDEKNIKERNFWANLQPQPGAEKLWKFIAPYMPNILSAPSINLSHSKKDRYNPEINEAIIGKKMWIAKNLSNVGEEIFVPAPEKAKFAAPKHILIDDMNKNIASWKAAGGIGILHTSATDTIKTLINDYGFNER
jgi:hypothetical protein